MNVSIIGTGYVGLVSGVGLAEVGHNVVCVDVDDKKIKAINDGKSPIHERRLDGLLVQNIRKGRLKATSNLSDTINTTDVTIIAVGTPSGEEGAINLKYIKQVSADIGSVLRNKKGYHVVVVKSTVVPSTTDSVIQPILENAADKTLGDFGLCMNPEFLREGCAMDDFLNPDRIVIGSDDNRSYEALSKLYSSFSCPILKTNTRTAEMIKYTNNAFLASLISFSNEIASICEEIGGVDVIDVLEGVCLDRRIMPYKKEVEVVGDRITPGMVSYLKPGCGFGGSCFSKDIKALYYLSKEQGYHPMILERVMSVNKNQPLRLVKELENEIRGFSNKRIAVWGLSFKPDTDDLRETPAKPIIDYIIKHGAEVICYDPIVTEPAWEMFFGDSLIDFGNSKEEILKDVDALIVVTAWKEFQKANFKEVSELMKKNAVLVDGRRMYKKEIVEGFGLRYLGVGYRKVKQNIF